MNNYSQLRFDSASCLLPERFKTAASRLSSTEKCGAEEFCLRAGRAFSIVLSGGELVPDDKLTVMPEDIEELLRIVSHGSLHTIEQSLKQGFVTAAGGHRIGVCGTAVVRQNEITGIRDYTSVSLRIAKEAVGCGAALYAELKTGGRPFPGTLIISSPGFGKTTLLRDMIRLISDGGERVSVADERGELGAAQGGMLGFDLGVCSDIMTGVPKAEAALMLLRTMNPQVVAVDEISAYEDAEALVRASNCGVSLLATIHARDVRELREKPLFRSLSGLFKYLVTIRRENGRRIYITEALTE